MAECPKCGSDKFEEGKPCPGCATPTAGAGASLMANWPTGATGPASPPTVRLASPFQAGDRVAGDYEIVGEVGRGAFGVVYEAKDIHLDSRVALKVLKVWEMPPGCIDIDRAFHAFWISDGFDHPVPNDSREPDDAVQRAAPLVAHGGEKLVLGSVRDLGPFFPLAPIVLDALTLDDLPLEPFVGGFEQGVGPLRLPEGAG